MEEIIRNWKKVRAYYEWSPEMLKDEGDTAQRAKHALSLLPLVDRTIMVLYAECGSLRRLGRMLGVSRMTAQKEVKRIRKELMEIYERLD